MMHHRRTRSLIVFLVLISLLSASATAVFAGSVTVGGTFPPDGTPTMPVISISAPNCTAQGVTPVQYDAWAFSVDVAGAYTFSVTQTGGFGTLVSLYLHTAAFNPAAGFPTCIAADNGQPVGFTETLAANTVYIAVPFDDTFTQSGNTYTLTISGPGNIRFGTDLGGGAPSIDDGRLNKYDMAATYAVYCSADSFEVWAIDGAGHGQLAFTTTADELAAVDASAANTVVSEGMGIRAFKLTSGEVQIVGAPDFEGKVYHVMFDAGACSLVDTFFD